ATLNTVSIDLAAGKGNVFRATGSTIVDPGFISVYQESDDDKKDEEKEHILPLLSEGQSVTLTDIVGEQHFTEPPPRYTEASLVKALEEHDIGRPSTYASIISTLRHREYVDLDKKRFKPTDVGRIVSHFLTGYFNQYVDYNFTAKLEDELDEVARGEQAWKPLLKKFWSPFKKQVDEINESVKRSDVTQEKIEENCPKCGKQLSIRLGKSGRFIGCTGFPECDYTRSLDTTESELEKVEGRVCPQCSGDLIIRSGKYGKFIGCSHYPDCNFIEPLEKPKETNVTCPKCQEGKILERKSRRGKLFYSCDRYPKCDYAIWYPPIAEACHNCAWPILMVKETKRSGKQKVCPQKDCGFTETMEEE
ncbi:MAG TPA: DNA topoisomerase, partial [Gammaproteobacteria bacterium]|nr:DNA topoisomerase [Gammaproteobacteria bacterium]